MNSLACLQVLPRVAEEPASAEVSAAESLQAVPGEDMVGNHIVAGPFKSLLDVIHQFADQDRGRGFAVVPDGLPHVADVEPLAGRKQGLQKQIAVILAAGPVAQARVLFHKIEAEPGRRAGEGAVVHSQTGK